MTVEEFIFTKYNVNNLNDVAVGGAGLKKLIKDILTIKFREQRQICADNALSYLDHNNNPCVSKGSILNAPEPEI